MRQGRLPIREKYSRHVGFWLDEVGQLNEVVHLWVYQDLNDRAAVRRRRWPPIADWQAFLGKAHAAPQSACRRPILVPTSYSPCR